MKLQLPLYLNLNYKSMNIEKFQISNLRENSNIIIIGHIRSGKSFLINDIITNLRITNTTIFNNGYNQDIYKNIKQVPFSTVMLDNLLETNLFS